MFDYYDRIHSLSDDKLMDEIESINKKIAKMKNPNAAIYDQLTQMLEIAQSAYQESMLKRRVNTEDTVLNIGEIQGETYQPDYSDEKLLDIIVQGYISAPKKG
jgi:hypothetical protein